MWGRPGRILESFDFFLGKGQMKQLIIAEKPSVARDIAKSLGIGGRQVQGSIRGARQVVTWCIGHLVELCEPHEYRPEWKRWTPRALPILPAEFKMRPVASTLQQWRNVSRLLRSKEFDSVVNACDAGREGELIFRMVYELSGSRLPVQRLWISSLTPSAIQKGFRDVRPGKEYDPLAQAAACRSRADWLVGINATRAATIRARNGQESQLFSIGRVQTPTLALIAERDKAIEQFEPRDYFELWATFSSSEVKYDGRWFEEESGSKLPTLEAAQGIQSEINGRAGLVESAQTKEVRQPPPPLFDLTSLQRTANRKLGFSAARTLKVAQDLYERRKLITYPRTDSRFLTPDLLGTLRHRIEATNQGATAKWAGQLLAKARLPSIQRHVRPKKVKDHHAILPTRKKADLTGLARDQAQLYDLIVRRFLGIFFPPARYLEAILVTRVDGAEKAHRFRSRGKNLVDPGWREVAGFKEEGKAGDRPGALASRSARIRASKKTRRALSESEGGESEEPTQDARILARLPEGQQVAIDETRVDKKTTRPPPRYNDASLLAAMEGAGNKLEERELRQAMKDGGLGTPATRAATIEKLLARGFVVREKKHLRVTKAGRTLLDFLPVEELKSPGMTGRWEARLAKMARGEEESAAFMQDIRRFVATATRKILDTPPPELEAATAIGQCPQCGSRVVPTRRTFQCLNASQGSCSFRIFGTVAGKKLTEGMIKALLAKGRTRVLKGFRSKKGRSFSAALTLQEDGAVKFDFDAVQIGGRSASPGKERRPARKHERNEAPGKRKSEIRETHFAPAGSNRHLWGSSARESLGAEKASNIQPPPISLKAQAPAPKKPKTPRKRRPALAEELGVRCPACQKGALIAGHHAWGCNRWREGCRLVIPFEIAGKHLTRLQVIQLADKGRTRILKGFTDKEGSRLRGRVILEKSSETSLLQPRFIPIP